MESRPALMPALAGRYAWFSTSASDGEQHDRQTRRASRCREAQWTLVGDRRELIDRLTLAGALVREVQPLPLEDAAIALLAQEVTP